MMKNIGLIILSLFFLLSFTRLSLAHEEPHLPEGVPAWVRVEPGTFTMGPREGEDDLVSPREITISRPFMIRTTEVTVVEWLMVMGGIPFGGLGCGLNCPIMRVSWFDVLSYANRLSRKEGLEPCYDLSSCHGGPGEVATPYICRDTIDFELTCEGYRLPTAAEWEYAYRAGTTTRYHSGDTLEDLDRIAWHGEGAERYEDGIVGEVHPIAQKEPNAWGLYDMGGNVREWVWDTNKIETQTPTVDPKGVLAAGTGDSRQVRGGGWESNAEESTAGLWVGQRPTGRDDSIGFRLVRTLPSDESPSGEDAKPR